MQSEKSVSWLLAGAVLLALSSAAIAQQQRPSAPPAPAPDRLAHLVLVPNPPQHPRGDFGIECGELRLTGPVRYTFSGIATYRPALFEALAPGRRPLQPILARAAAAGLATAELHGGRWADVGTPERLAQLDASLA